ncbi:MAG: hypothetical protein IPM27_02985 [Nitrosomonadales bacterium]|nr:hypothetical protein [Nitrosomonadales bacterium]
MTRNRATIASIILLAYFLISSTIFFWSVAKSTQPIKYLLFGPGGINIAVTLIVCATASWGLWKQRLWGWQFGIALAVIKLLIDVSSLITFISIYFRMDDASASPFVTAFSNSYWKILATTGFEIFLLLAFLRFLLHAKTREFFFSSAAETQAEQNVTVNGLGLANISLALAFAISAQFSIGGKVLVWLLSEPLLRSIPPYQGHLFNVLSNYWIPAVLIYLVFRLTRVAKWLRPTIAIQVLIGLGNLLFVLYVSARVLASAVQGGGASFVVMQFAPIVVLPARGLMSVGLVWLMVRAFQAKAENWKAAGFKVFETVMIFIFCMVPLGYAASFFLAEDGAFRLAREARKVFKEKCVLAGEVLPQEPVGEVKSLYLDNDWSTRFGVKSGVLSDGGGGILGEPLVNSGWLLFFETKNQYGRQAGKFKKYSFVDGRKWEYGDAFTSKYAVFVTDMVKDIDPRLKVGGAEVSIVDLEAKETIASTTYFISRRDGKFCGDMPSGYFDTSEFIRRALGLKMQYPAAWAKTDGQASSQTSITQQASAVDNGISAK